MLKHSIFHIFFNGFVTQQTFILLQNFVRWRLILVFKRNTFLTSFLGTFLFYLKTFFSFHTTFWFVLKIKIIFRIETYTNLLILFCIFFFILLTFLTFDWTRFTWINLFKLNILIFLGIFNVAWWRFILAKP